MNGKQFVMATMIALVMLTVAFIPLSGQVGTYDPWLDVNDDGKIDGKDIALEAKNFGTTGTPINKTALLLELLSRVEALETKIAALNATVVYLNETVVYLNNTRGLGVPDYDSGWLASYGHTNHDLTHNLNANASELLVYVLGMYGDTVHQWYYGGYDYLDPNWVDHRYGILWSALDKNTIRVSNWGDGPTVYNYVRVKIWKIPQP